MTIAPPRLSQPTLLLFHIASRSHTLAEIFGIEMNPEFPGEALRFLPVDRPWLIPHPVRPGEVTFDAATFAHQLERGCSKGQHHMIKFILNVWNPSLAQSHPSWQFDLFAAMHVLDREAIAWWLRANLWP